MIHIKRALILLLLSSPIFADSNYKAIVSTSSSHEDSLQGWNGKINDCDAGNEEACWSHSPLVYPEKKEAWRPVVQLGGGVVITSKVGQPRSFTILNPDTDQFYDYNTNRPSQDGAFFEIFLGGEFPLCQPWSLQGGVDFSQVYTNYSSTGIFTQGSDEATANQFNYSYDATIRQVLAEGKLFYNHGPFHPYGLLGLGAAFNSAYNYSTSVPPFATFTRQFSNNFMTSFSWALGLGVDLDVTPDVRLGLGYRYTDFGEVELGPATINGISVSGTLAQTHTYSNVFLAQVTFLF